MAEWEAKSRLGPDMLVDTGKVQAQQDRVSGERIHVASFTAPLDCTQSQVQGYARPAIDKWLEVQEKRGWVLTSRVEVAPTEGFYRDPVSGAVVLDVREYRVRGVFKYTKTPEPIRIEVNPALIRQAPDQPETRVGGPHKELSALVRAMKKE